MPTYLNIASTTLGSTQSSVTFSGIPSTYTDLVLKWCARSAFNGTYDVVCVQMNGVTTSNNYNWAQVSALGTTSGSNGGINSSYMQSVSVAGTGTNSPANGFGLGEMYVTNYLSSTRKFPIIYGNPANMTSTLFYQDNVGGQIIFTSAISSITLTMPIFGGAGFAAGSTFYLYGIKNS